MENSYTIVKKEVFCRYIRKNGRIIYPKNARFFHFWVDEALSDDYPPEQMSMFEDIQPE